MALYVISDLHLSTFSGTNKSMDVFGGRWENYTERLKGKWESLVGEGDTVIIPGDISWGLTIDEALSDLTFVNALPGRKILLKGNHDLWWATMKKNTDFCQKHELNTLCFVYNSAVVCEDFIVAGTRGWFADEETMAKYSSADFEKIRLREIGRLKLSLDAAKKLQETENKEILVFMHFPVVQNGKGDADIQAILKEYGVRRVYYGHIHGGYTQPPFTECDGIVYALTSADYLSFTPKYINP